MPDSFMYNGSVLISASAKHEASFHSITLLHLPIHFYYIGQLVRKQAFILFFHTDNG